MPRGRTATISLPAAEAPAAMTPAEKRHLGSLERRIEQGLQTFREVGTALLEIRDSRLYRESHASFEAYCAERWQLDRQRAYQFIGAAQVVAVLGDPDEMTNEAQARELVPLLAEGRTDDIKTIWARVEETNEPVTAGLIRRVRSEVVPESGPVAPPSETMRLVGRLTQAAEAMRRWKGSKPGRKDKAAVAGAMEHLSEVYAG